MSGRTKEDCSCVDVLTVATKRENKMEEERRIIIDWFSINLATPTDKEVTKFIDRLNGLCCFYAKDSKAYSFNFKVEE